MLSILGLAFFMLYSKLISMGRRKYAEVSN